METITEYGSAPNSTHCAITCGLRSFGPWAKKNFPPWKSPLRYRIELEGEEWVTR